MTDLIFEWDERKNRANQRKHGVAFEEARTALADENARVIPDTEHSETEERFVLLGLHCTARAGGMSLLPAKEEVIRIISARKADRDEQRQYRWWLR